MELKQWQYIFSYNVQTKSKITKAASSLKKSIVLFWAKWKLRRKLRKTRKMCYVIEIQSESIIIHRWTIIFNIIHITRLDSTSSTVVPVHIVFAYIGRIEKGVKIVKVMYLLYYKSGKVWFVSMLIPNWVYLSRVIFLSSMWKFITFIHRWAFGKSFEMKYYTNGKPSVVIF